MVPLTVDLATPKLGGFLKCKVHARAVKNVEPSLYLGRSR